MAKKVRKMASKKAGPKIRKNIVQMPNSVKMRASRKVLKQLTPAASLTKIKDLIKEKKKLDKRHFIPGNLLFFSYDAKDKSQMYDKTPMVLVLKRNNSHTLGLNFHWLPFQMRLNLIKHILNMNESNIRNGKPLEFSYQQLKPMLKSFGYAPVIRLYINKRISKQGVVIPPERFVEVARLRLESLTGGVSAEAIYSKIRKAAKKR